MQNLSFTDEKHFTSLSFFSNTHVAFVLPVPDRPLEIPLLHFITVEEVLEQI